MLYGFEIGNLHPGQVGKMDFTGLEITSVASLYSSMYQASWRQELPAAQL